MSEGRVCLQGEEMILGVQIGNSPLKAVLTDLREADGDKLWQIARRPGNLCVVLKPGTFCLLPAGYLYASFFVSETLGLRWSFSPAVDGEDNRVSQTCAALLEAAPALRKSEYMAWYKSFA